MVDAATDAPGEPPIGDTGLLLSVGAARAVRNLNVALSDIGLRARSFSILELAVWGPGVNQRQLASALQLNPSQLVALIDDLVAAELVTRVPDRDDRRNRIICATEKGRACHAEARALADEALERTLRPLTPEQRATLHALLQVLDSGRHD